MQGEANDVDVATAGADGREGDGGVGLGDRRELGDRAAQRVDEHAQRDAGRGSLGLVEADVEGEAAGRGAGGEVARDAAAGRLRAAGASAVSATGGGHSAEVASGSGGSVEDERCST